MKRSKLVVALMLLSLAFASFVSVPVMSSENPWDADSPGSEGGGTDSSSTGTEGDDSSNDGEDNAKTSFSSFETWLLRTFYGIYLYFSIDHSNSAVITSNDNGKSQDQVSGRK